MTNPERPAAYICAVGSGPDAQSAQQRVIAEHARQRGWPAPTIYAEPGDEPAADDHADPDSGPEPGTGAGTELAALIAAISTGRHDAVLLTASAAGGDASIALAGLLQRCTSHGVAVHLVLPPAPPSADAAAPAADAALPAPFPVPREAWTVLGRARLEALSGLFPDWRIWLDNGGWHARRRASGYLQSRNSGAPAFCVRADNCVDLAAQLCWQQAADRHAPAGCAAG
jgi:hypothetical protein